MVQDNDLQGTFRFTRRPTPVSLRLRPTHRIALLLLMINKCRARRASPLQLHTLDTAISDPQARAGLIRSGTLFEPFPIVRVDPALNRAIDRAIGFGLVHWRDGRLLELTDLGTDSVTFLESAGLFLDEKRALDEIQGQFTQAAAERAIGGRRWV